MEKATNCLKSIGEYFSQHIEFEKFHSFLPSQNELRINFSHKVNCTKTTALDLLTQVITSRYPPNSWEPGLITTIYYLSCNECGVSLQFDPNKK